MKKMGFLLLIPIVLSLALGVRRGYCSMTSDQKRPRSGDVVFPIQDIDVVWKAVKKALEDNRCTVTIENKKEGYIIGQVIVSTTQYSQEIGYKGGLMGRWEFYVLPADPKGVEVKGKFTLYQGAVTSQIGVATGRYIANFPDMINEIAKDIVKCKEESTGTK